MSLKDKQTADRKTVDPYKVQIPGEGDGSDDVWMSLPHGFEPDEDTPPGLYYLSALTHIFFRQQQFRTPLSCMTTTAFMAKNVQAECVYFITEWANCLLKRFLKHSYPFHMAIHDKLSKEVIHLHRPLSWCSVICPAYCQRVDVYAPPRRFIGSVQQSNRKNHEYFEVRDPMGEVIYGVEGPLICNCWISHKKYFILNRQGEMVGKIAKKWHGVRRDMFSDEHFIGISFPKLADGKTRAIVMAAAILIETIHYEH